MTMALRRTIHAHASRSTPKHRCRPGSRVVVMTSPSPPLPAPDTGEWMSARVDALRALREEMKGKEPTLGQAWRRLKQLGLGRGPGRPVMGSHSLWEELHEALRDDQ
jgi:hypothetical protein